MRFGEEDPRQDIVVDGDRELGSHLDVWVGFYVGLSFALVESGVLVGLKF